MPPMRITVGVHEARTHFSKLVRQAEAGVTVTITRRGKPVAELGPPAETEQPRGGRDDKAERDAENET